MADLLALALGADLGLQLHDVIGAALLRLLVDLVRHFCGHGVFLGGVGKAAEAVKPDGLDEVTQLCVLLLGLTGEARDQRRAQRDAGDGRAQPGNRVLDLLTSAAAVHGLEHRVITVLDGQVEIGHDLGVADHGGNKCIADTFRIGVQDTDPADAVDFLQAVQQLTDGAGSAPVLAVGGGVLRDQNQLAHTLARQPAGLGDAVVDFTAAQRTADQRNGAVIAAIVAALGNF